MSQRRLNRTCKILYLFLILLSHSVLHGQILMSVQDDTQERRECEPDFELSLRQCIDELYFYKWENDALYFHKNDLFKEILKKFFCRPYTNSLQCIHEMLVACMSDETTRTVQDYLSKPWARHYNNFCDINQQNTYTSSQSNLSQNNLIASISKWHEHNSGVYSTVNSSEMQTTVNKITNHPTSIVSRFNRLLQSWQKKEVSSESEDHFNSGKSGSRQSVDQTGNTRDNVLNNFLFYTKSVRPENTFQRKQNILEYHLLFQRLTSDELRFSIQSSALGKSTVNKPSESKVEMLIEIEG